MTINEAFFATAGVFGVALLVLILTASMIPKEEIPAPRVFLGGIVGLALITVVFVLLGIWTGV